MKQERTIIAYKHYFAEFISSVSNDVADKIGYVLDVLKLKEEYYASKRTRQRPLQRR